MFATVLTTVLVMLVLALAARAGAHQDSTDDNDHPRNLGRW